MGYQDAKEYGFIVKGAYIYQNLLYCCEGAGVGHRNLLCKRNSEGDLIWATKIVLPPDVNPIVTYLNHDIEIAKDGSVYFHSQARTGPMNTITSFINKFNSNGDLCWMKTYPFQNKDMGLNGLTMTLAPDSLGIIFNGSIKTASGPYKEYVVTAIDSAGVELWVNSFTPLTNIGISLRIPMVTLPDSTLFIAYDNWYSESKDYFGRLDKTGHPMAFFTNPYTSETMDLRMHPSGNVIYLAREESFVPGENGGMRIQMLSPDFDTIWSYLYFNHDLPGAVYELSFVNNLSILPDGRILTSATSPSSAMNIICLSPTGALLWKRKIFLDNLEPSYNFGWLQWAEWGEECIWVSGYIRGIQGDSKAFLIKLDTLGCLDPGCESSWVAVPTQEEVIDLGTQCWSVSPNPANSVLNIVYTPECVVPSDQKIPLEVNVISATGKNMTRQVLDMDYSIQLNSSVWPPGVYFIQIRSGFKVLFLDKVIVSH